MPSADAFTIAMLSALFAAALWINLATWIGAPVSTTHSVVGGVLGGVGFLRELMANRRGRNALETMPLEAPPDMPADADDGEGMALAEMDAEDPTSPDANPNTAPASPEKARRRYLARRSHLMTIIAAWLITVPVSAGVAALLALGLSKWGLPGLGD